MVAVRAIRAKQGSARAGTDARRSTKAGLRAALLDPADSGSLPRSISSGRACCAFVNAAIFKIWSSLLRVAGDDGLEGAPATRIVIFLT